jgi:thymidylate synthase
VKFNKETFSVLIGKINEFYHYLAKTGYPQANNYEYRNEETLRFNFGKYQDLNYPLYFDVSLNVLSDLHALNLVEEFKSVEVQFNETVVSLGYAITPDLPFQPVDLTYTPIDTTYEELGIRILQENEEREDRTGTGTVGVFGTDLRYDLNLGFPLITSKKVHLKSIIVELLWFLTGDTNIKFLKEHGVTIWDEWAKPDGSLGPVYGEQWRKWKNAAGETFDQIADVIEQIKTNPYSRRLIVSAWNVGEIDKMALPPCHAFFQFHVSNRRLSLKLTIRSSDFCLGKPFNIASYALLTHMVAQQCDLEVGEFIISGGDTHIYSNHVKKFVEEQLPREPIQFPLLNIKRKPASIFEYELDDFELINYKPHPSVSYSVAV